MMGTSTDRINKTKCLINRPCLLPQLHRTSPCQRELWIQRWSWLHVFQCQLQPDSDVKALCQLPYFSDNLDENLAGQQTCDVTNINLLNILTNTRSAKMSQGIHCCSTHFFQLVTPLSICHQESTVQDWCRPGKTGKVKMKEAFWTRLLWQRTQHINSLVASCLSIIVRVSVHEIIIIML